MKRTESYVWSKMKRAFVMGHYTRHEDECSSGIPDVSFGLSGANGWIELKCYARPLPESIPKFKNFKRTQKSFLSKRGRVGGGCFILVGFGDEVLLFDWTQINLLGKTKFKKLQSLALATSPIKNIKVIEEAISRLLLGEE